MTFINKTHQKPVLGTSLAYVGLYHNFVLMMFSNSNMNSSPSQYSFNDFPIFTGSLNELPEKSSLLINTINQYSFCMANVDEGFRESLKMSDILLPDGIAMVAAEYVLSGNKIKKVAGADVHEYLMNDLNEKNGSCFYLGASESTLTHIKDKISVEYPNVTVGSYSPPFKKTFSREDNKNMVEAVNSFEPDVVFVGMTAPKQEKWAYKHKNLLNTRVICTIGAVFDFYAGTIKRPGKVWQNLGLEWLGRLLSEPARLWKRYLYYGPVFVWLILKEKFLPSKVVSANA
jgi:N-acetylglucosaminyldiphosphoundecaprenol N-acetyl-beta-D-mannosaminyltransferase